jgi:hypothetical protein
VRTKNCIEELRKTSFGWPGNESSGWAKNRAVINRPKSLHLILRHKKIHSDLSYTLKAWLIIFIKFWNCSYLWYLCNVTTEKMSLHTTKSDVGIEEFLLRETFASNTLSPSLVHCLSERNQPLKNLFYFCAHFSTLITCWYVLEIGTQLASY